MMGHTEKISDSEFERAWTTGPVAEGVDIEAEAEKSETKAKKVEASKSDDPKTSSAKTKSK